MRPTWTSYCRVMMFAAKGLTTPKIAKRMGLAPGTGSSHLYRAMRKLGVHDRHDAVAILERGGVIGPKF